MAHRVVYFDLETGGLETKHPVIQLAAVATDALVEVESFEAKIRFDEASADPAALAINSYDAAVWAKEAKPEREVVDAFSAFLRRHATVELISKRTGRPYNVARLAGHNVLGFDAPRLLAMFKRHDVFLAADAYRPLDTLQLSLWCATTLGVEPAKFTLSAMCEAFGVDATGAHDALADVRMCVKLTKSLLDRVAQAGQIAG